MVRKTSKEAYDKIIGRGLLGPMQTDVYEIIYRYGPMTPGEAWAHYKYKYPSTKRGRNEVAKRFTELKNMDAIEEVGERSCRETGFNCYTCDVTGHLPKKEKKPKKPVNYLKALDHVENKAKELLSESKMPYTTVVDIKLILDELRS